ncbi:relaxase/mobilization nuclease domain-containing protein [Bacteroides ovatus]|nr:relaxase/mobilization nuclease domain-containing protein [Bacteroides ovatus]
MIGKIKKGSGFKGCVNYVLGKEQAVLLHADGVLTESRGDIIRSFCMQTGMNPDLKKPVGHIALSYSAVDAPKLTDEKMVQLAQEYMREMKITDTQYIIVRHQDREHPHVHIVFNRIDNNGNTISDRHERLRSTRICKELTLKYGLHMAGGKDNVKRNRLKEPDRTKYALYDIIKMEVGRCGNWNVLIANLKRQGVEVHFKHKGQTSEVQGVVFSMNGYHFNGSKVDRRFSYSKIDAALQHNRCRERMGITAGIYETATPSAPSGTAQSELFNGSWGLLKSSGSSYNAADAEANQEMVDILRRRKKVKRKRGVGF